MNDNAKSGMEEWLRIVAAPCDVCGAPGDVAVSVLDTGNLAVMAACPLHWPPGAMTPEAWVEAELARNNAVMARYELLFWLLAGKVPEGQVRQ